MAKYAISEKALTILNFLRENHGANMTAADIAESLGFEKKSVDGVVTAGLCRGRNLAERIPAEIELEDGTHRPVKFIKATDKGMAYDHQEALAMDAVPEAE